MPNSCVWFELVQQFPSLNDYFGLFGLLQLKWKIVQLSMTSMIPTSEYGFPPVACKRYPNIPGKIHNGGTRGMTRLHLNLF